MPNHKASDPTWIKRIARMCEIRRPHLPSRIVTKEINRTIRACRITRKSITSSRRTSRNSPRVSRTNEIRALRADLPSKRSIKARSFQRPRTPTTWPRNLTCQPHHSHKIMRAHSARSEARSAPSVSVATINLRSRQLSSR